jgi:hypothetical protein
MCGIMRPPLAQDVGSYPHPSRISIMMRDHHKIARYWAQVESPNRQVLESAAGKCCNWSLFQLVEIFDPKLRPCHKLSPLCLKPIISDRIVLVGWPFWDNAFFLTSVFDLFSRHRLWCSGLSGSDFWHPFRRNPISLANFTSNGKLGGHPGYHPLSSLSRSLNP